MRGSERTVRLLAVVVAMLMLAAACSDDGGSNTSPFSDSGSDDSGSDDSGSDDSGSDDSGSDDSGSDDSGSDTGSDDTGSDDSDGDTSPDDSGDDPGSVVVPGGNIDCVALGEAMDAAGDIVATDPLSSSGDDNLEQSFAESRAQFEALKSLAPEIADDVDAVLAGMDVLGEMFASLDWDTANLAADPARVAGFVEILSDPAFLGMTSAFSNIGLFIGNACS